MSCAKKFVGASSCWACVAQPLLCRAPPDPTRPWCVRVFESTNVSPKTFPSVQNTTVKPMSRKDIDLSNPKPGHTTGGSGRGARRSGRARSGKIGCQLNYSPRKQKFTVPSKASKKCRFNVSPEARTSEILCKPTEEQNDRLTSGLSPVYHRFISGTRSALCSWLLTSETMLFCPCKPFSCNACPGIIEHALHEKGLPKDSSGPLVSSQGQTMLSVQLINRLLTADFVFRWFT